MKELWIGGTRRINHWRFSSTAITSGGFYQAGHSRIAIYAEHEYNVHEKPTSVVVGETRRGGESRECTKPPLSRGNRGVLCAFRASRSIMHRVHDGPSSRTDPNPEMVPFLKHTRRLFRGVDPGALNDISNPPEGKIYVYARLSSRHGGNTAHNRLARKSRSFGGIYRGSLLRMRERGCSPIESGSHMRRCVYPGER